MAAVAAYVALHATASVTLASVTASVTLASLTASVTLVSVTLAFLELIDKSNYIHRNFAKRPS